MHFLRRIYLYLFVAAFFIACKERIVEVSPAPVSWQLDNNFLFDEKIQLTSYADTSMIILSGSQTTSIAPGPNNLRSDTSFVHYSGQAQPNGRTDYRPLLKPSFFAFLHNDYVNIIPTSSPVQSYVDLVVGLPQLDSDFARINTLPVNVGETLAANQQNQLIIPYQCYDRSYDTPVIDGDILGLALVSIIVPAPPAIALTARPTRIVRLPEAGFMRSLSSVGDYFIVSTIGGTFRIAPDGTYRKTYPYSLLRQFSFKGTAYGITYADGNSLQLVASQDQGSTWVLIVNQLSDAYRRMMYTQVNNLLIGTYNSQLFQLNLTATTLNTTELENTGLYGNRITSVAAFRNTVYVSTLSGVFTKPLRTFLTSKKE